MTEYAYAKLNISLDVLGARPDGYHDMRMVMQSISLCDDVEVSLRRDGGVFCRTDARYLPCDDRNIAVKAAKLFFRETDMPGLGADIFITKRTPTCAGMAGGSSDGAAVLRALNKLTGAGMSGDELEKLSEKLGSDVPFCIRGGTALAEGRGELLTDLPELPDCGIVVCKPDFAISTPELFGRIDGRKSRCRPDTEGMISALGAGDLKNVARRMYNVFEDVLQGRGAEMSAIKSRLLDEGAMGSSMTGTGSAVFGIFPTETAAARAYDALRSEYRECFLTLPVRKLDI